MSGSSTWARKGFRGQIHCPESRRAMPWPSKQFTGDCLPQRGSPYWQHVSNHCPPSEVVPIFCICSLNRAAQHDLERDSSDKFNAQNLDEQCFGMRNQSRGIAFHNGVHRIDRTWVVWGNAVLHCCCFIFSFFFTLSYPIVWCVVLDIPLYAIVLNENCFCLFLSYEWKKNKSNNARRDFSFNVNEDLNAIQMMSRF